jgi:SAM-dependent methyltransferase
LYPGDCVDVVCNVEKDKLPYEDNTVDGLYTNDLLEHVQNFDKVLREIHRVCKNGSLVEIIVPHFCLRPYEWNVRHYRYDCFIDYEVGYTKAMLGIPPLFKCLERKLLFSGINRPFEKIFNRIPFIYEGTLLHNIIPCHHIYIKFEVVK